MDKVTNGLGPLPPTAYVLAREGDGYSDSRLMSEAAYCDDQMRAYALQEMAAERERRIALQEILRAVGSWEFRGRSVAETYDIANGAGSWRRALRE